MTGCSSILGNSQLDYHFPLSVAHNCTYSYSKLRFLQQMTLLPISEGFLNGSLL